MRLAPIVLNLVHFLVTIIAFIIRPIPLLPITSTLKRSLSSEVVGSSEASILNEEL